MTEITRRLAIALSGTAALVSSTIGSGIAHSITCIEIVREIEVESGIPVQRSYMRVDGTRVLGPLNESEIECLLGIMKRGYVSGTFIEEVRRP